MLFENSRDSNMVEKENLLKKKLSIELVHHHNIMSLRIYTSLLIAIIIFGYYDTSSASEAP